MNSLSLPVIVVVVVSLGSVVIACRRMLSGRLPPADFRKQFRIAWVSAGMLAVGATWVILPLLGLNRSMTQVAGAGGLIFGCFVMTTYPMSLLAQQLYERTQSNPDFAEDDAGNPAPLKPPD
jgi:hypothetical protein